MIGWTYGKLLIQKAIIQFRYSDVNSKLFWSHCLLLLFLCSSCVLRTRLSKLWSRLTHRRSPALLAYYGPAIVKHCASESNDNLYKIYMSTDVFWYLIWSFWNTHHEKVRMLTQWNPVWWSQILLFTSKTVNKFNLRCKTSSKMSTCLKKVQGTCLFFSPPFKKE